MNDSKNDKKNKNTKENIKKIPVPTSSRPSRVRPRKESRDVTKNVENINAYKIEEDIDYEKVNFEEDKTFKQIKEELNKASNFIDYFLIIGVDPNIFTNQWLYSSSLEELNNKEELKPKIISYFPPYEKTTICFDDSIIKHCFPNGFNLCISDSKPNYKLFSFILDNNYFNLNYPQKFLTCLIFYESIDQYKELFDMNQNLENLAKKNAEEDNKNNLNLNLKEEKNKIYIPKCLLVMSLYPFFSEYERILLQIYNYSINKVEMDNIIYRDSFRIKRHGRYNTKDMSDLNIETGGVNEERDRLKECKKYKPVRSQSNLKDSEEGDERDGRFRNSIKHLYKRVRGKKNTSVEHYAPVLKDIQTNLNLEVEKENNSYDCNLLIDKFIENLLIELPVPPKGDTIIKYTLMNEERELKQNRMNQLPLINVNLKTIFLSFSIDEIINIYHHLFLETRVLFFSQDISSLNIFIYGLLSLLYPFEYQYQIVTILPKENFEIIESITPFIAGINEEYEEDFFDSKNLALSDCILVVDLDKCKINLVNGENSKIPDFPKHFKKQLDKNLNSIINQSKNKNIIEEKEIRFIGETWQYKFTQI